MRRDDPTLDGAAVDQPLPRVILLAVETLSVAELQARLSQVIDRVDNRGGRVTVTVDGRPAAVILSVDDLESMEETLAVLSDPQAMRELARSQVELDRGKGEDLQTLAAAMRARRPAE